MKIIFLGNWNLGYMALDRLHENGIKISLVVTNFDKNDNDAYRNKVYDLARSYGLPVYKTYKDILSLIDKGDTAFSVAYGNEIFKQDILDKIKIYNFHPSYLPYYKGPSPILWQIKNGESEWGMTCHEVDEGIDTGQIVERTQYHIDYNKAYEAVLDEYNECFAWFILKCVTNIIDKNEMGEAIELYENSDCEEDYKPHLSISGDAWEGTVSDISEYLNRDRILFFAGNRAELGIMFPVILEMSKFYYVDVAVSDTYLTNGKQDLEDKKDYIKKNKYRIHFIEMPVRVKSDIYFESLPSVYQKVFMHLKKQEQYQYKYTLVLGDRIESLGFALAVFYGKVPLVHMSGGDTADVPYFDNSARHCISKLAALHLTFSEESAMTLRQMGEEEARICNIGCPSFDYERMGLLLARSQIDREFHIGDGSCVIFTYHSGPLKTVEENLDEFKECLQGILDSRAEKIIISFPNHDPGSAGVLDYIGNMADTDRIAIVKSLGTVKLHSIMKNFKTVIAGNSSMGLLETAYYMCPALNIGDRQTERIRGGNVTDAEPDRKEITNALNHMIEGYDRIKKLYIKDKMLFGNGNASAKAREFLDKYSEIPREKLIVKKFVHRWWRE